MNRFDRRTRTDGEERHVSALDFFTSELAHRCEAQGDVVEFLALSTLGPLAIRVDGATFVSLGGETPWRYEVDSDAAPVSTSHPAVVLSGSDFDDLYNDHATPVSLLANGRLVTHGRGALEAFLDHWLMWRAALDGAPVHPSTTLDLPDDLQRTFTLDDPIEELADFLDRAGYLHLRGVFSEAEMQRISDDMDAVHDSYAPGDANSWWATLADGTETLVRMQRFEHVSAAGAALLADDRFTGLSRITQAGHTAAFEQDSKLEALYKPIGVVRGISDVPWHRDCSLGRHSYFCPSLTIGVSVSPGGPTSGQLRVIAGSHKVNSWPSLLDVAALGLPNVALATRTGDVTVHQSCLLHMAQPPTTQSRRVLYADLRLALLGDAEAVAANHARLQETREAAPLNTSQVASGLGE